MASANLDLARLSYFDRDRAFADIGLPPEG